MSFHTHTKGILVKMAYKIYQKLNLEKFSMINYYREIIAN